MTAGSTPERTCIGCRRRRPASELVRVTRLNDGSLAVGRTLPGRGAWLCARSPDCLEQAVRRSAFARALRAEVLPAAVDALREHLAARSEELNSKGC